MTHIPYEDMTRLQRYYQDNKERFRQNKRNHRASNRDHVREQARDGEARRRRQNPQTQLKHNTSCRVNASLRAKRNTQWFEAMVGCSVEKYAQHIEGQFKSGMSWENRSRDTWHIDHIRPLSSFDLTDPAQLRQAYHWTNTRPLWAMDNWQKTTHH